MEFYDIRQIMVDNFSITVENGKVELPKVEKFKMKGFRVLKNGFWGIFTGNVPDDEGLKIAERNAIGKGNSKILEYAEKGKFIFKQKKDPSDIPADEKISFLLEIDKILKDKFVTGTRIQYIENKRIFRYKDSFGTEVYYELPRIGIIMQVFGKDETMQYLSKRILKPGGFEVLDKAFEHAEEIKLKLKDLLKARSPPSGKMNVIMDSTLAGVFIHEAFGHAVEADHVLQGTSILANKIGEKVASDEVTIFDDPTIPEFGFYPFDDEGVRAKRKVIVKNGVLESFLHSRETAAKMGGYPGNARAEGVDVPLVRMSNTYLAEGDYSLDELLEIAKKGVFLVGSKGGETNPATGYFQFSAQYGYVVENSEIKFMIKDVSVSGHTLEILKNAKVGKGLEFDPGFCGKSGQSVPVADGAPPVLTVGFVGGK